MIQFLIFRSWYTNLHDLSLPCQKSFDFFQIFYKFVRTLATLPHKKSETVPGNVRWPVSVFFLFSRIVPLRFWYLCYVFRYELPDRVLPRWKRNIRRLASGIKKQLRGTIKDAIYHDQEPWRSCSIVFKLVVSYGRLFIPLYSSCDELIWSDWLRDLYCRTAR